ERRLRPAWELHAQAERNGAAQHLPRALLEQKAAFFGLLEAKDQERACRAEAEKQPPRGAPDACATGRELMIQARHGEALAFLLDATRQAPEDASTWFLLGRCQEDLGHNRDAVASYSTVLGLRPQSGAAYFRRGLAYLRLNDNPQA